MNFVRSRVTRGLSTDGRTIAHGQNSGYQAINLAYYFGVSRIILIGYDMQHTGGATHWHGNHPKSLTNAQGIEGWRKGFSALADDLDRLGVEVINCTISTALECFRQEDLRNVV